MDKKKVTTSGRLRRSTFTNFLIGLIALEFLLLLYWFGVAIAHAVEKDVIGFLLLALYLIHLAVPTILLMIFEELEHQRLNPKVIEEDAPLMPTKQWTWALLVGAGVLADLTVVVMEAIIREEDGWTKLNTHSMAVACLALLLSVVGFISIVAFRLKKRTYKHLK